jgi:outer membrane protein
VASFCDNRNLKVLFFGLPYLGAYGEVRETEEQKALAHRLFEDGLIAITDFDETTARAESATAQLYAAESDVSVRRAELKRITGTYDGVLAELREQAVVILLDAADVSRWTDQALEENLNVRVAEAAVAQARLEALRAKGARLPTIDAFASYGRTFSSGDNTNMLDYATDAFPWEVGIQVSWPILDGGRIQATISEMDARWHKALQDLEAARRDAAAEAYSAYQRAQSGMAQIKALRSAMAASLIAVAGNEAGYRLGTRINSDVLNAQRQLYADQRDLARARYETLVHGLELKAATGDLQRRDLQAVNALLTN